MVSYTVNINIDPNTSPFLKDHDYSLYAFKGINAGPGAISTVWQIISGDTLYDNPSISIKWDELYYIGETTTQLQNSATITGVNPYTVNGQPTAIQLNALYKYEGNAKGWNQNQIPSPSSPPDAFWIENDESKVNNFYVSQQADNGSDPNTNYIAVQQLLGNGGNGYFQPIEVVALIFANQVQQVGTLIEEAFSPGAIITMVGTTEGTVTYDKDKGWSGAAAQVTSLNNGDPIYQSMLQSHLNSLNS
jgi:hypothetical protein